MKKTLVFGFALAFSITPLSAFAAVNSINGLTAADQSLVSPGPNGQNTMHMDIVTVGTDTHRFKWDGTPWRVDQGGTGWSNIAPGTLIYGNGSSPLATTTPAILGDILQFNGTFPTWVSTSSLGIVGHAAGSDGEIQFNDNGVFGADSQLRMEPTGFYGSPRLVVPQFVVGSSSDPDLASRLNMNPSQVGSHIWGGSGGLTGGNVTISNVEDYPDGVRSGGGDLEGGTIQSSQTGARRAELLMLGKQNGQAELAGKVAM